MTVFFERKNQRWNAAACASILGVLSGKSLVKDFSVTGCCLECARHIDVRSGESYHILVYPEEESRIGEFDVRAKVEWIEEGESACEVGFSIEAPPGGEFFKRYVDYLEYRMARSAS